MQSTLDNLRQHATEPLARWLIHAARHRSSITYGAAKRRLETEVGFDTIFSSMMGKPAGTMMDQILAVQPDCPLLNVLLVRQGDGMPGDGAGGYMAKYLRQPKLAKNGFRDSDRQGWRTAFDAIARDVYAFRNWGQVYQKTFGRPLPAETFPEGAERDGTSHARGGEGPNHKALRLWVKDNPHGIRRSHAGFKTATEVILESADRVDVVYYGSDETIVIEVKSLDSDEADLRRGVFQCIKYRAVMKAMDVRLNAPVVPVLVTQADLPGDLKDLVRRHEIQHFKAPRELR